jgi:hypothetical protein
MNQAKIEEMLGLTNADAEFINANKAVPCVRTFCDFLAIQSRSYDPGGFAMAECTLKEVRQRMAYEQAEMGTK